MEDFIPGFWIGHAPGGFMQEKQRSLGEAKSILRLQLLLLLDLSSSTDYLKQLNRSRCDSIISFILIYTDEGQTTVHSEGANLTSVVRSEDTPRHARGSVVAELTESYFYTFGDARRLP